MSIQPVSSNVSLWQTMQNDFQTLSQDLSAAQTAQKSGDQDQIQISQEALQKAMASLQNDITGLQKGHHHHRHHGANGSSSTTGAADGSSSVSGQTTNPFQTFSQDLTAFQNALNSGNQDQIQSSESTLQNDISAIRSQISPNYANGQQQSTTIGTVNLQV